MSAKINKNGKEYDLGMMPIHYPADRVYLDGDTSKTVQNEMVKKSTGGTFNGNVTVDRQNGTTSSVGITEIVIGNNKGQGVDKNSRGFLYLFSTTGKWVGLRNDYGTANRDIYFPDKSGTIALTSDISSRKFKENINDFSDEEAKKLLGVEIITFDYKEGVTGENKRYGNKGVIAEQVEPIIPYVVEHEKTEESEEETLRVDYRKFIPYLIKMVQMQQEEIDNLKAEISALKK